VVGQGVRLAGVGVALGILVALVAMRQLSGLLFGVSAYDPVTFAAVALLLMFCGPAGLLYPGPPRHLR